ncbi:MAG: glycosyltransferase family 4 protein [Bacteroidota bacterium]|nr:glycosyltransferase family 4 protein [Bacteroidota bacterium]
MDISPSRILRKIYELLFWKLIKKIFPNSTYDYFRSYINYHETRHRIKKAVMKYKDSQINIFLTFSFSSLDLIGKPIVLFGDWTYDHYFDYFENREPGPFEKGAVLRENRQIENADLVFPLFPGVTEYMKDHYKNDKIFYLGNVINSLIHASEEIILEKKSNSYSLLFIGDIKYLEGAKSLIKAFDILKKKYCNLSLDIVGMTSKDFESLPSGVICHGFLNKGVEKERKEYYQLLENAKVFINTTPKWGAFSASIEAMYFYNPVIVTDYNEFIETFGNEIGFGIYCKDHSVESLCLAIENILHNKDYATLCSNAHFAVKDFTWNAYIDKMLKIMKILVE